MKKTIVVIALVIACLIPTYILVFQAVRTAVPEATFDGEELSPAYVRWSLTGHEDETSEVSQGIESAKKRFDRADPVLLSAITDLARVDFSLAPARVQYAVYNLSQDNAVVYLTPEELATHPLAATEDHLQVVLLAEWVFHDAVSARAAYSFEVNG